MEIFDLRVYVGDALTNSSIKTLANAPTDALPEYYKCAPLSAETTIDTSWVNGFGQNCQWFFENSAQNPGKYPTSEIDMLALILIVCMI